MKLAIFGATGPTGLHLVQHALQQGHHVLALVRNPSKMEPHKCDNLQIEEVDIFSSESLTPHLQGCDAVLSCLGAKISFFSAITTLQNSMKAIVPAMRSANVTRLIALTAWCTVYDPSHPKFVEWFLKPLFIGRNLTDMAIMEDYLMSEECRDIDYTIIRPPGLNFDPATNKEMMVVEGQFVPDKQSRSTSREDVAKFMLTCLDSTCQWQKKAVAICISVCTSVEK